MSPLKWYFAISETSLDRLDHDWRGLVIGAVISAKQSTTLVPYMLYDGRPSSFTAELEAMGVTIIRHRISFYDELEAYGRGKQGYLSVASGAFLRIEIPLLETEDEIILYTDVDVIFLRDPLFPPAIPTYFAAGPQESTDKYDNMNSGVMLMNVPAMRQAFPTLRKSILSNLDVGLDQEQLALFFKNRYALLHPFLNWKPYWGVHPDAQIVHWHGPKPVAIRKLLENPSMQRPPQWEALFQPNVDRYAEHLALWERVTGRSALETRSPVRCVFDDHTGLKVRGWAFDHDDPASVVQIQVRIDSDWIEDVSCALKRPDVVSAYPEYPGVGGFAFDIPAQYADGRTHFLQLYDRRGLRIEIEHDVGRLAYYEFASKSA
jgi:hypothetical protein